MRKATCLLVLLISLFATKAVAQMNGRGNASARDTLFLEATIDNRTPYVGQEVLLTYALYFNRIAPRIADSGKADHPGLWAQEVTPEGYIRSTSVTVRGKNLRKAVIKQFRLLPMQAGKLSISNYRLRCFVPVETGVGQERIRDVETVITAPAASVDAKPLPKGAPAGFSGAVGDFSIKLSSDRFQVHAGDPLTISVRINGKGNLKAFPQVSLKLPEGFRQLETAVPMVTQESAGQAESTVSSKITLTSDHPGMIRFAPIRLAAFNPWKGRYETITSEEISVSVLPEGKTPKEKMPDPPPAPPSERDEWLPPTAMIFMALAVLLLIAALSIFGGKSRKQQVVPAKKSTLPAQEQSPLQAPESAESLKRKLYETLGKAGIQNPAGLTSHQLKKALSGRRVRPECAEGLMELMKMIDHAVYTPGKTSHEALEKMNRKATLVFEALSKAYES